MTALDQAQRSDLSVADADPLDKVFEPDVLEPGEGKIRALRRVGVVRQVIKNEKPWHRTAAYLAASGFNQMQIAHACDVSPQHMSLVAAQPWFLEEVGNLIAEFRMGESARDILEGAASAAAMNMVVLMQTASSEAVKLNASRDVLDRVLGKADQTIVHKKGHVPVDPAQELNDIEKELARLRGEQQPPNEKAA